MTRIESAARDYAIACLARRDWMNAEGALSLIGEHDAAGALQRHFPYRSIDPDDEGRMTVLVWRGDRRVGARVALYLRCLRRCEALDRWDGDGPDGCERRDEWSRYRMLDDAGRPRRYNPPGAERTHASPLWTTAPAHDPAITPRQRRAAA